jgi:toxin HigB-1
LWWLETLSRGKQGLLAVLCVAPQISHSHDLSFRHKGLRTFFETCSTAGIPAFLAARRGRRLTVLKRATDPQGMNQVGWKLQPLQGGMAGPGSVWVPGNWRLTFAFKGEDVELIDYQERH